jgi:hypothetical protein
LGDAVLELSPSIAKAVRSLAERGVQTQISDLLDDLDSMQEVFAPVAELGNEDALLIETVAVQHSSLKNDFPRHGICERI